MEQLTYKQQGIQATLIYMQYTDKGDLGEHI